MLALKPPGRLSHGGKIQPPGDVQNVAPEGGRYDRAAINVVVVGLGSHQPASMKLRGNFLRMANTNRRWQQGVQRSREFTGRVRGFRLEIRNLACGMNPGISAARAVYSRPLTGNLLEKVRENTLNRALAWLRLPAVKIASVVSDNQLDIPGHGLGAWVWTPGLREKVDYRMRGTIT